MSVIVGNSERVIMSQKTYQLPELKFGYEALWPYITEEQLRIHHTKHHQSYVNNANQLLEKIKLARKNQEAVDIKSLTKALSFNIGGHVLHSLFWSNLQPADEQADIPQELNKKIEHDFGSFDTFQQEFASIANSVEGSGWAALVYDTYSNRLHTMQVEKHNTNLFPNHRILLVLDVWEHAYYIDYRNERNKFVDSFWEIVNWKQVNKRLQKAKK